MKLQVLYSFGFLVLMIFVLIQCTFSTHDKWPNDLYYMYCHCKTTQSSAIECSWFYLTFTVDLGEVKTAPTECKEKCFQMSHLPKERLVDQHGILVYYMICLYEADLKENYFQMSHLPTFTNWLLILWKDKIVHILLPRSAGTIVI